MSVRERRESAGFNGSFEIAQSGLPVNWYVHYPPLKNQDIDASLDAADAVDGKQSWKFVVHRVGGEGWRSPGFFQVASAEPGRTYRVSFWLKNQGSEVSLFVRSEKPKSAPPPLRRTIRTEELGQNTWRQFECVYTVPPDHDNIRFELNIRRPGVIWVDDVRIEEVQNHRHPGEAEPSTDRATITPL